jgi:hypothetical protein
MRITEVTQRVCEIYSTPKSIDQFNIWNPITGKKVKPIIKKLSDLYDLSTLTFRPPTDKQKVVQPKPGYTEYAPKLKVTKKSDADILKRTGLYAWHFPTTKWLNLGTAAREFEVRTGPEQGHMGAVTAGHGELPPVAANPEYAWRLVKKALNYDPTTGKNRSEADRRKILDQIEIAFWIIDKPEGMTSKQFDKDVLKPIEQQQTELNPSWSNAASDPTAPALNTIGKLFVALDTEDDVTNFDEINSDLADELNAIKEYMSVMDHSQDSGVVRSVGKAVVAAINQLAPKWASVNSEYKNYKQSLQKNDRASAKLALSKIRTALLPLAQLFQKKQQSFWNPSIKGREQRPAIFR